MRVVYNHGPELKSATEVRAFASKVQRRINEQRRKPKKSDPPQPEPDSSQTESQTAPTIDTRERVEMLALACGFEKCQCRTMPRPQMPVSSPLLDPQNMNVARTVLRIAASRFEIPLMEFLSARRTQRLTYPRFVAFFIARRFGSTSYPKIARVAGGRDHSTIHHGCRTIERMIASGDEKTVEIVNVIGWEAAAALRRPWDPVSPFLPGRQLVGNGHVNPMLDQESENHGDADGDLEVAGSPSAHCANLDAD